MGNFDANQSPLQFENGRGSNSTRGCHLPSPAPPAERVRGSLLPVELPANERGVFPSFCISCILLLHVRQLENTFYKRHNLKKNLLKCTIYTCISGCFDTRNPFARTDHSSATMNMIHLLSCHPRFGLIIRWNGDTIFPT